eukprot:9206-Heterococcus_DN1.PRE.4
MYILLLKYLIALVWRHFTTCAAAAINPLAYLKCMRFVPLLHQHHQQSFMGSYSSALGAATFLVIFGAGNLIKHLGWKTGALAAPLSMALLAAPLFAAVWGGGLLAGGGKSAGNSDGALKLAVMVGAVQSILSKSAKCALFDPTLQMAYIPLDNESKVQGKAAIDGLGSRLGKSGGSLILQGLVLAYGSVLSASPAIAVIFYSVLAAWTAAASRLAVMFEAATNSSSSTSSSSSSSSRGDSSSSAAKATAAAVQEAAVVQGVAAAVSEGGSVDDEPPALRQHSHPLEATAVYDCYRNAVSATSKAARALKAPQSNNEEHHANTVLRYSAEGASHLTQGRLYICGAAVPLSLDDD